MRLLVTFLQTTIWLSLIAIESLGLPEANKISQVDLRVRENVLKHRTEQYRGQSIVLRRGEQFHIILGLKQNYNRTNDRIRLEFGSGANPMLDKGTLIYLPLEATKDNITDQDANQDKFQWNAKLTKVDNKLLYIRIDLPANMAIGKWQLRASTKLNGTRNLNTFLISESIYVIFNAWCKEDAVYMAREDGRNEYVLTEIGKIYIGSYSRPSGRQWTYGQFNEYVLPSVMYLLDKTRLDVKDRSNVVKVARAVSAIVNSHDENGLLVGNWSGNYGDGLAPWQWTGSAPIFERYYLQNYRPVKFGQCWVFGGVTTTALRTLGIPARTISNFVSAHDTDLSLTVDKFYSERGGQVDGVNGDSIWNFHVWSDAWMERYDLPRGFGGWQAIDATPQETSMGNYQLGPASLEAIKQGKVEFAYDVGFVFSEVNADLVNWRLSGTKWLKERTQTDHVGKKILTKKIGILDTRSTYGVADSEDIIDQYKHPEGSREERQAFNEATKLGGLKPVLGTWIT